MNARELELWGKIMRALLKVNAIDELKEIIDYFATLDKCRNE